MILSDVDIKKLIKQKKLVLTPPAQDIDIKEANINLHLSGNMIKFVGKILDLKNPSNFKYKSFKIEEKGYALKSGEYLLGSTVEKVYIPNGYFGFIETKGNIARAGIQIHNTDGHVDPGFSGNITLEIKNNSNVSIIIYPNIPIAQFYIFKLTSKSSKLYNGKYQNQKGATTFIKD